jgi:hypothetical protein
MSNLLKPVIDELDQVNEALKASITTGTPLSLNSGSWNFPGLSRQDLMVRVTELKGLLSDATDPGPDWQPHITSVVERLTFLRAQTVPHILSQGGLAVSAFLMTIEGIQKSFAPILTDAKAQALKNSQAAKKTATQIRSIETRLKELTPRTKTLDEMVGRIEKAYDAADQLPTDLETLAEAQGKVSELLRQAEQDKFKIEQRLEDIAAIEDDLRAKSAEAEAVLQQSVTAYSSATSVGLAAAFTERSKGLDSSMWGWVGGLVAALMVGSFFGSSQLRLLTEALANPDVQGLTIGVNLALAFISVGGPVWFAWLSTKQIGQRFRLSEDYAFKASISRAYEGYRREASRIDPSLERQLLESALSRLDEQPLRLVENDSFGSPWHELLSSDLIKDAVKSVPGFVDRMSAMASSALQKKSGSASPQPGPAVASNDASAEPEEAKV